MKVVGGDNALILGYSDGQVPVTTGVYQSTYSGNRDIFLARFNNAGSALVFSTMLGGAQLDNPGGLAVDASGNIYVTGYTTLGFPTTAGAYRTAYSGSSNDAFLSKFNSTGTSLLYSTYLGGIGDDQGVAVAVDSSNRAWVIGSSRGGITATAGAQQALNAGGVDAFVAQFNSTGTGLDYASYLGGSSDEYATALALDSSGNAFVAGYTGGGTFPSSALAYQTAPTGNNDAFVASFSLATLPSPTPTSTTTPTSTGSATSSATQTSTSTPTCSETGTATATGTASPTATHTATATPSGTGTGSATGTASITPSATNTVAATLTGTSTATSTITLTGTATTTASNKATATGTFSHTKSATTTGTQSATVTVTATQTASPTGTATSTTTKTATASPTGTITASMTMSVTASPTPTLSPTQSQTFTSSPTFTHTPTITTTSAFPPSDFGRNVLAPVPCRQGEPLRAYFVQAPAFCNWQVFNVAGQRVANASLGSQDKQILATASLAPGVYFVRLAVTGLDGSESVVTQKVAILP